MLSVAWNCPEPIYFGPKVREFPALAGVGKAPTWAPPISTLLQPKVVNEAHSPDPRAKRLILLRRGI